MTGTVRPTPLLIAEDPALDFLNTIAAPWGSEIEWIADGYDLLDWLEVAELVPTPVLARLRREAKRAELEAVAVRARKLREWFRSFVAEHSGRPLEPAVATELRALNEILAGGDSYRQIDAAEGAKLRWRRHRRWHSADSLLLPLAEAMGDLLCRVDFDRVKRCDGVGCTLWFRDVSQNHTRRWCSMAVCGNRAKAAAHRARKRSAT